MDSIIESSYGWDTWLYSGIIFPDTPNAQLNNGIILVILCTGFENPLKNSHFRRYESITSETFGDMFLPLENSF